MSSRCTKKKGRAEGAGGMHNLVVLVNKPA